jgi:hypothetical protein
MLEEKLNYNLCFELGNIIKHINGYTIYMSNAVSSLSALSYKLADKLVKV